MVMCALQGHVIRRSFGGGVRAGGASEESHCTSGTWSGRMCPVRLSEKCVFVCKYAYVYMYIHM
jgi:hypothetical protein